MKKKSNIIILAMLFSVIAISSMKVHVFDAKAATPFTPTPDSPNQNVYWDFDNETIVGWKLEGSMGGSVMMSLDLIYNITNMIYATDTSLMAPPSTYHYAVGMLEYHYNLTYDQIVPKYGASTEYYSGVNFTYMGVGDFYSGMDSMNLLYVNPFIPTNGSNGLMLQWCANNLWNDYYDYLWTMTPTVTVTPAADNNMIELLNASSGEYVRAFYYENGTLKNGEIYTTLMGMLGGQYLTYNFTRLYDFNPIDEVEWDINIGDILYYGIGLNETKFEVIGIENKEFVIGPITIIHQDVIANMSIWNFTTELWMQVGTNTTIGIANDDNAMLILAASGPPGSDWWSLLVPKNTTPSELAGSWAVLNSMGDLYDTTEQGDLWVRLSNSTSGDYVYMDYFSNGIIKYGTSQDTLGVMSPAFANLTLYYKNMTVLSSGIQNVTWDVLSLESGYNITAGVEVTDNTEFFFAGFPDNPTNEPINNELFYFDVMINETSNVNFPINLTIEYIPPNTDNFELWYFNDSLAVLDWEQIPLIDDGLGKLKANLTHSSIFAINLTDTNPPSITTIQVSEDPLEYGNIQTITSLITDPSGILSATAFLELPDETIIATIGMVDDGTNGDASPGDNIYTCQWNSTGETEGVYFVDINATDDSIYQHVQSIDNGQTFTLQDSIAPSITDIQVSDDPLEYGSTQTITANVSDLSGILSVTAFLEIPDETVVATPPMVDDGTNGDATSGDGIYTCLWASAATQEGPYYVDINATDNSANQNEQSIDNGQTFIVQDTIAPSITNVQVSNISLEFGNNQTITATVSDTQNAINNVTAFIEFPDETIIATILMVDDGTNGDITASDGIYTCQWNSTGETEGTYYLDINATDNSLAKNEQSVNNGATFILSEKNIPIANLVNITDVNGGSETFGDTFRIEINATDDTGITSVTIYIENPDETVVSVLLLYDDGTHGDTTPGDGIYTNSWDSSSLTITGTYVLDLKIVDSSLNLNELNLNNIFTISNPEIEPPADTTPPPSGIPLGNYYLIFMVIGIIGLVLHKKRKLK